MQELMDSMSSHHSHRVKESKKIASLVKPVPFSTLNEVFFKLGIS